MTSVSDLFRRHHLPVFRYLRRMTGSDEEAEDLTQEVFLRAVRTPLPDDPQFPERAWLFHAARNLLLNRKRDAARRPGFTGLEAVPSSSRPHHSHDDVMDLQRALAALDDADREVFVLREQGGFGYEDIAKLCGFSPDAVRSRICRARAALRISLSHGIRRVTRRPSTEARPS